MKLKTLNDMNLFFLQRKRLEEEFYEYTKKDRIDNTVIRDCPMNVISWFCQKRNEQIRQEAIKWIEFGKNAEKRNKNDLVGFRYWSGFIKSLELMFNVTEEDLKWII